MKKIRIAELGALVISALVLGGCSTTYIVNSPSSPRLEHLTSASLKQKGQQYEVLGLVHCENWAGSMYWGSDTARMRQTLEELNSQATIMGADAVVDVQTKAENHYQFAVVVFFMPFIFNHDETHVSGTAVKYVR
jgi:hypothetical protein